MSFESSVVTHDPPSHRACKHPSTKPKAPLFFAQQCNNDNYGRGKTDKHIPPTAPPLSHADPRGNRLMQHPSDDGSQLAARHNTLTTTDDSTYTPARRPNLFATKRYGAKIRALQKDVHQSKNTNQQNRTRRPPPTTPDTGKTAALLTNTRTLPPRSLKTRPQKAAQPVFFSASIPRRIMIFCQILRERLVHRVSRSLAAFVASVSLNLATYW